MKGCSRPDRSFWQGRRVLLTGHTGFKGAWLAMWLHRLGAKVTGISLAPSTEPNLFTLARLDQLLASQVCDIRDPGNIARLVKAAEPEVVFHLAAQPLVRESYARPLDTFAANIMGTAHVLDALRGMASVRAAVMVTTDKVYRNLEQPYPYREDDALGGHDPYSASKAACELVVASYRDAFLAQQGTAIASARAGNVIGGGDWSADRLIPDAVRAWATGVSLDVRRPEAIRPWQHVLDPLAGYLALAEHLWLQPALAGAWNFGPLTHEAATVRTVVELARSAWGSGEVTYGDGREGPHEAGWLALEIAKARTHLGTSPKWSLDEAVTRTVHWYRQQQEGADARSLCYAEIEEHESEP
jgi:CDP-glucose 4,6-dehydratase